MKVLLIFGTRPEAIKMAPLVQALKKSDCDVEVCVTGQHREMLDQVLDLFGIVPEYDLNLMKPNQDLTELSARMLIGLKDVLLQSKPDWVGVHGDTTTSMIAGLASFYQKIPVFHVEAGLRTGNKLSPWPEEMNRSITGSLANLHFAPTVLAKSNLTAENIDDHSIVVTGNTVIDALLDVVDKIKTDPDVTKRCKEHIGLDFISDEQPILLVTGHRRENFGQGFENICLALKEIAQRKPELQIIYPVHLNPNVQQPVNTLLSGLSNVHLIPPQDYLPFVYLMSKAHIILTDSGGIQEEAPSLGKPVLVMRDTTERPEAISAGTVKLVGTSVTTIVDHIIELLDNESLYQSMSQASNPYGDGQAASRIANHLMKLNA
ncbi:non-hydrolyzing UDP-N-acetylglucosamine 2-epimerase [Litoribacillus peritrichatus]|uniref:UDP-N-acetylglucosamine 2-epimerase (non-hydrolyzing) n=1 Tax=Litoribacillus peritrichatus TaxID=718191 RepID=A0ABP7MNU8_9GAMM